MTHVWLDWLVKVAVATAMFGLLALAAGVDQAGAAGMDPSADRSASWVPVMLLVSALAPVALGRLLRAPVERAGRPVVAGR